MLSYIGSENIISPLGVTALETFSSMQRGEISIKKNGNFYISTLDNKSKDLTSLIIDSIQESLLGLNLNLLDNSRNLFILSTTKGEINKLKKNYKKTFLYLIKDRVKNNFLFLNKGIIISTACISGLQSLIVASDMITNQYYDNVIVTGADLVSNFVLEGFSSFFALSDTICKPFDIDRDGLNLGEAVSTIVLSNNRNLFKKKPLLFLGGSSSNDSFHISAPDRYAKGLINSIKKTFKITNTSPSEIDYINAHGTGTIYNDEMESIAFSNMSLQNKPLNSFKGYFGHTLGASGVIETSIALQCMRENYLLKSMGYNREGTSIKLNIIRESIDNNIKKVLKTSSGFGGFNASAIIEKT